MTMDIFPKLQWKWEDMCGPEGFHPWIDDQKDFGQCFQELCLQIPVLFIAAIVSGYYVGYRTDWVIREKTQERAIIFRSFVVLALMFIPIIELYIFITNKKYILFPIDYFTAGASCLSWLMHFGYILALKHRLGLSSRGPTMQLILWGLIVILNIISLRTSILTESIMGFHIAKLCCHGIYFITLLPSSNSRPTFYSPHLVGSQHSSSEYTPLLPHMEEDILGTAMQGSGWFSKLTFTWVNPLLEKGLENKLQDTEELYDIPTHYRCSYVGAKMDKALIGNVDQFQQYAEVPHEPFIGSGYGSFGESQAQVSTPVTPTSRVLLRPQRRQNISLLRALHTCFALQFYSIGILKLISDMAGFAGPMLLNKLVTFVEDETIDQHLG